MRFRYELFAFGLFALSMTPLSARPATRNCVEPLKPMGVTMQPCDVITPPQAPTVCGCFNYFFTADFIYWKTTADRYQYAVSGVAIVGSDNLPLSPSRRGQSKSPGFEYEPGFKVGAGLKFAHDGWDLYANYTWLNPARVKSTQSAPDGDMFGPGDPYFLAPSLTKVKDRFQQRFNILDLELGRKFFISKFMSLRPYFGLKSAWIKQHNWNYLTIFNNATNGLGISSFLTPPGVSVTNLYQEEKVKAWGIGIRGGVAPVWYFMKNFGLYGNFALSGMWTFFRNFQKTSYQGFSINIPGAISGETADFVRTFQTVTPVVELGLGLTYIAFFHKDAYAFTVSAGWEEQMWIDFNGSLPGGNMTLQGLTVKAGFEF